MRYSFLSRIAKLNTYILNWYRIFLLVLIVPFIYSCTPNSIEPVEVSFFRDLSDSMAQASQFRHGNESSIISQGKVLFDSLWYYEQQGDELNILRIKIDLAENFRAGGNYVKGIEYLHHVLNHKLIKSEPLQLCKVYNRLAAIYFELNHHFPENGNHLVLAQTFNEKALELSEKYKYYDILASSLIIKAAINILNGDFNDAEASLLDAKSLSTLNDEELDLSWYANMAELYYQTGRYPEGLELASKLHEKTYANGHFIGIMMSLVHLEKFHRALGNHTEQNRISLKLKELGSEQMVIIDQLMLGELASSYESERATTHIQALHQQQTYLIRRSQLLLLSIIVIIVITMTLIYIMRQRNKMIRMENQALTSKRLLDQITTENQQMQIKLKEQEANRLQRELKRNNEMLESKNKQLTEKAMVMMQKNEFIAQIAKELMYLSKELPDELRNKFDRLIGILQSDANENLWQEFEARFVDVHSDFYKVLNKKFPTLSPSEKKLAAFLRLNMTSKEIAAITSQSPDSIKVARSRLRKKLGIQPNDNLISFLETLA